jgi:hypothetical protein
LQKGDHPEIFGAEHTAFNVLPGLRGDGGGFKVKLGHKKRFEPSLETLGHLQARSLALRHGGPGMSTPDFGTGRTLQCKCEVIIDLIGHFYACLSQISSISSWEVSGSPLRPTRCSLSSNFLALLLHGLRLKSSTLHYGNSRTKGSFGASGASRGVWLENLSSSDFGSLWLCNVWIVSSCTTARPTMLSELMVYLTLPLPVIPPCSSTCFLFSADMHELE